MDIQSDQTLSIVNRPGRFSAVLLTVLGIVRWLIGFFTVTEQDRLEAGIYRGYAGWDER